jgi:hypothetical protein
LLKEIRSAPVERIGRHAVHSRLSGDVLVERVEILRVRSLPVELDAKRLQHAALGKRQADWDIPRRQPRRAAERRKWILAFSVRVAEVQSDVQI